MTDHQSEFRGRDYSSLLALPRELRDKIYLFLLHEWRQPPEDPSHAGNRIEFSSDTYVETLTPKPALLQLKLCSTQLHAETTSIVKLHQASLSTTAHLDILVKGTAIYPTWLHLPLTPSLDGTIEISIRLFSPQGGIPPFAQDAASAYRSLWLLFRSIVFKGAYFYRTTRKLRTPLNIKCLRFDIQLCHGSMHHQFETSDNVFVGLGWLAKHNVGHDHVERVEACFGSRCRTWAVDRSKLCNWDVERRLRLTGAARERRCWLWTRGEGGVRVASDR